MPWLSTSSPQKYSNTGSKLRCGRADTLVALREKRNSRLYGVLFVAIATSDWKLRAVFRFPLVQKWNWFVRDTECSESYKIHRLHTNIAKGAITTCNILFHNVSIFDLKKKRHIETCKSNLYFAYLCNGRPELVRRSCHNSFASTIRLSIGCLNTW